MDTQWDDDRVRATLRERSNTSAITGLPEVGFIVQLHDHGPPGERLTKPVLMFDSESAHGTAGQFGDHAEADAFADRRQAAELRRQREIEVEQRRRKDTLSERLRECWEEERRQKEIAKAASKAAKDADALARQLAEEAESPEISVSCNPTDDGWSLWVAPCWTDGTQDGDPRQLAIVGSGMLGPRKLAASDEPKPRKRRGKKPPPRSKPAAPENVADAGGLPIKIGSAVTISVRADGLGGWEDIRGQVTKIGAEDPSGAHEVEIAGEDGRPYSALSTECVRSEDGDEPVDDWPDPEPA